MPDLRPYQIEGSRRLQSLPAGILGDDMGLGKTPQVIEALKAIQAPCALVVGPSVAKGVWARECKKWGSHLSPSILSGTGSFRWPRHGEIVITNYDILPMSRRALQRLRETGKPVDPSLAVPPNPPRGIVVIGDEAHYCKSNKAERTQSMRGICREAARVGGKCYALTGTPIKNTPVDLYHILDTFQILPYTFQNYPTFVKEMGGVGSGRDLIWFGPTARAKKTLETYMIRRTQAEVLPEIPPRTDAEIHVELSSVDRKEVEKIIAAAGWTVQDITPETFHQFLSNEHMMRARACLASAKVQAAMEWCDEAEACEEPAVVFSQHRDAVKRIGSRKGWAIISGDTSSGERTIIEDAFQAGKLKGIAANIQAGGVAITLTKARMMLFIDKAWTNADNRQAVGRIFRYGQERPVTIYSAIADHPLDERIAEILAIKDKDAESILGDEKRKREQKIDEIFASI